MPKCNTRLLAAVLGTEEDVRINAAILPALAAALDVVDAILWVGHHDRYEETGCDAYGARRLTERLATLGESAAALRDWRPPAAKAEQAA